MNLLKVRHQKLCTKKEMLENEIEQNLNTIELLTSNLDNHVKARWCLTEVARLTQERFKTKVETLVTTAIKSVYDRDFNFKLIFEQKRNKLEIRPVIEENGFEFIPEDENGGGLIDIVSFAFRIVLWHLEKPKSRNVFILDEPLKNLGILTEKACRMMKELSEKLNIQIIMITHDNELVEIANKSWKVNFNKGISEVVEL